MKKILSLIFTIVSLTAIAQSEIIPLRNSNQDSVLNFVAVEKLPVFEGCEVYKDDVQKVQRECLQKSIIQFVAKNFELPEAAQKQGIGAKIYISFVIEKDGSVSNTEILMGAKSAYENAEREKRKAAAELDKAAINVVEKLKFLEPAMQKGKAVRMSFTLPISAKFN
jgi:protein TonB